MFHKLFGQFAFHTTLNNVKTQDVLVVVRIHVIFREFSLMFVQKTWFYKLKNKKKKKSAGF